MIITLVIQKNLVERAQLHVCSALELGRDTEGVLGGATYPKSHF